ncbi:MAG: hypothetical protein IID36_10105 [Planctomycetes bacterium]|nr:hypothetical protein [Planctomycetota bacterium]
MSETKAESWGWGRIWILSGTSMSAAMLCMFWWKDQLTVDMAEGILIGAWLPVALYLVVRYVFRKKKETGGSSRRTADGPGPNGDRAD